MTIAVIGTGYVGLVTGAVFADLGHRVFCVDNDPVKIARLKKAEPTFYEPGLEELVRRNLHQKRLTFTTKYQEAIPHSRVIFICVGTPPKRNGEADLTALFAAARETAQYLRQYTLIVIKSTVPIGVEKRLKKIIRESTTSDFEFASCPEFLREGSAVNDTQNPDRIVIGTQSKKAADLLLSLYQPFNGQRVVCDLTSAQMIKYAANAFLAMKISFANAIANLSEKLGADAETVLEGIRLDQRIGKQFLNPGIGFGGSCFPKDLSAFVDIASKVGYQFDLLKAVEKINSQQIELFVKKISKEIGNLKGKTIGVLGLSFKPDTDDIRESPAIKIIQKLLAEGAKIKAYDPLAANNGRLILGDTVELSTSPYEAISGVEAMIIATEWNEFKELDLTKAKRLMSRPRIFDGRNIYDPKKVHSLGFGYWGVGRS